MRQDRPGSSRCQQVKHLGQILHDCVHNTYILHPLVTVCWQFSYRSGLPHNVLYLQGQQLSHSALTASQYAWTAKSGLQLLNLNFVYSYNFIYPVWALEVHISKKGMQGWQSNSPYIIACLYQKYHSQTFSELWPAVMGTIRLLSLHVIQTHPLYVLVLSTFVQPVSVKILSS